ncbi:LytR/AlgR family response regulator transcription factor [Runella sp.]|uniref:LytR/AlgR family response regulator transcription factor n=1 Tax=Runella sp. TaxID=1960881 RepID=UPI003D0BCDB3
MKNTFSALIVEDNPLASAELTDYLAKTNMFEPPTVYTTVADSFNYLNHQTVDILFLDLDLPDLPGLELLKLLQKRPPVIITSLHIDLAVDCFDFDVADFLTKPYSYTRLLRGIHRAIRKQNSLVSLPEPTPLKKHIFLQTGRSSARFELKDILYIEAYGVYVKVMTASGVVVVNQMLSNIEENLPETSFLRIHRSFVVNLDHLKRIEPNDLWVGSHQIPIGLSYKEKVRQKLKNDGIIP